MPQPVEARTAVVTGATGQDGFYLVKHLLDEGWSVHAAVRDPEAAERALGSHAGLRFVRRDLRDPGPLRALVGDLRPEELYNLAGESSVGASFGDPRGTWESNAHVVSHLLDAIRHDSPDTRFYQASSGEMFGSLPGEAWSITKLLRSIRKVPTRPPRRRRTCSAAATASRTASASPAASSSTTSRGGAAANFSTRKVVDHVGRLRAGTELPPLHLGNLKAERDWGFAPDYVEGMVMILRQATIRDVADEAGAYRDYVLGTGHLHAVWELADRAFMLAGLPLEWTLDGDDPLQWSARFTETGAPAVVVDPTFIRPSDPAAIAADPSRIERDLGWNVRPGLDRFLTDMLEAIPTDTSQ